MQSGRAYLTGAQAAACAGATLALAAAVVVSSGAFDDLGMLSQHMLSHVVVMGLVAPMLALSIRALGYDLPRRPVQLLKAAAAQLAVLLLWHTPRAVHAVHGSHFASLIMALSLLLVATWFWVEIQSTTSKATSAAVLLVTGKLLCLAGAVLAFAPVAFYAMPHPGATGLSSLADQHRAGLIMLIACPLTYVSASAWIAVRWLAKSEQRLSAG